MKSLCKLHDLASCGKRIRSPHVGDDANAVALADRQQRAEARFEQGIEAGARIGELAKLRERDGALGEALEPEIVELALRGEDHRGLQAIALEAGARANPDRLQ